MTSGLRQEIHMSLEHLAVTEVRKGQTKKKRNPKD
jgi:hypothetical protein